MAVLTPARTWTCVALCVLFAGCAGQRDTLRGPRPQRVTVIAHADVAPLAPANAFELLAGGTAPRTVVEKEAARVLRERGYQVAETPSPDREPAVAMQKADADAALVVRLRRLDLRALQALGQADVQVEAELVGRGGAQLWSGGWAGRTNVALYHAQRDWRVHVRDAVDRALGALP